MNLLGTEINKKNIKDTIVIIGAFDRYNYGDNLMPILFEKFLEAYYPAIFTNYNIIYSAMTDSDLSKYKVKKTVSMHKVFNSKMGKPYAIISIGGEVLCASSSTLFLHMNHPKVISNFISFLKKNRMTIVADIICRRFYKLPWEYPYIPENKSSLTIFNTVGGVVPRFKISTALHKVKKRISQATYISVRDSRDLNSLQGYSTPHLYPDSAIVMAEFVDDHFLNKECRKKIRNLANQNYICFQSAPKKSDISPDEWVEVLRDLSRKYNVKIKLCPIGYANGHDDVHYLSEIFNKSGEEFELLEDLNIWEILYTIKNSKVFIGTSLHGVITALSYSVPYIGLNPNKVPKLNSFLKNWGIYPSDRSYSSKEIINIFDDVINVDKDSYLVHSAKLIKLALENNHAIVKKLNIL